MKVFLRVLISGLFFLPLVGFAAPLSNAGFLQGGIWYSKDPFFAGETVRVYAAIFNSSNEDIAGTVEFLDNKRSLGTSDFFVERGGKFSQVWVDWSVTEGEHTVEALITKASLVRVGSSSVPVELGQKAAQQSVRKVERDTDGDGIGNAQDTDDDNDGLSDAQEKIQGTDPLVRGSATQETENNAATTKESNITDTLISYLPPSVEKPVSQFHEAVREALAPVVKKAEEKKEEVRERLEALNKNPETEQAEKTKESLYLASVSTAAFALKTELILYVTALSFSYLVLRAFTRRLFKR